MPAAGATRLGRVVLGGCLAFWAAPFHAQETVAQASFAGRSYILVREGGAYAMVDDAGDATAVAVERGTVLDSISAIGSGWLSVGRRPVEKADSMVSAEGGLVLVRGDERGVEKLPVPPTGNATTMSAQALVEGGELVGLVWLEGSDSSSLGVRAAAWNGSGWAAAEWVATPVDGSQLALSATVLRDGSWLLVWSAFDGADDEILWSRRDGTSWSEPRRLHADNRVPDITPALAATADGAVVAWSRYDAGAYRGRVMRFEPATGWRDEERVGGPHTVFPFFAAEVSNRGPVLVFREGIEGRWDAIELGARGEIRARARFDGSTKERPVVRRGAGGAARLEWIGGAIGTAPPSAP
jgi:hypothetical protein